MTNFTHPFRFANPASAMWIPIGTNANYSDSEHPETTSLDLAGFNFNIGGLYGVATYESQESWGTYTVQPHAAYAPVFGALPVTMKLPPPRPSGTASTAFLPAAIPNQYPAGWSYPNGSGYDNVVCILDGNNIWHEFYRFIWQPFQDFPMASGYRTYSANTLGHPTPSAPGRLGVTATGVSMMFGALRAAQFNNDPLTGDIGHAMQAAVTRIGSCSHVLGRDLIFPANYRDASADVGGNNLGNVPYGRRVALPPSLYNEIPHAGMSVAAQKILRCLRDFGVHVVDGRGCSGSGRGFSIRTDQWVDQAMAVSVQSEIGPWVRPRLRAVLHPWEAGQTVIGGGTPLAPPPDPGSPPPSTSAQMSTAIVAAAWSIEDVA